MLRVRLGQGSGGAPTLPKDPNPTPTPISSENEVVEPAGGVAHCPFCARSVSADLVQYGGKCPNCFGEIPGEEAPTDPGEEKRRAERKAQEGKVQRSKRVPLLVASFLLMVPMCGAVSLTIYSLLPYRQMDTLNLDAYPDFLSEPMIADPPVVAVAPPPVEPTKTKTKTKTPKPVGTYEGVNQGGSDVPPTIATAPTGTNDPTGSHKVPTTPGGLEGLPPSTSTSGSHSGTSSLDPHISMSRIDHKGVTLYNDDQIVEMVKTVVGQQLPKLRYQCYEDRLKTDETIQGSWTINFTISQTGDVTQASADGKDRHDPVLESCIVGKVKAWQFQPIKASLPVSKSVAFRQR
jgi:hypothetical protein